MSDALAEIEAQRAERRAKREAAYRAQRAIDLATVGELEDEHGEASLGFLDVPFEEGRPSLIVTRTPKPAELKRYRARVKIDANGNPGNTTAAAEELAAVTVLYPKDEELAALYVARPGLQAQIGGVAVRLALGRESDLGKG